MLGVIGMDEAGRGAWAGPVLCAALYLAPGTRLPAGIKDSKQLTLKQREAFFEKILQKCPHGIGLASAQEVDDLGLIRATERAFERALQALPYKGEAQLWVDGKDKFIFSRPHTSLIRGDQKMRAISAASILAKVYRDRLMLAQAKNFPDYDFELHKGYGTARHQKALQKKGLCSIHRRSYAPLRAFIFAETSIMASMDSPQSPQKDFKKE